MNLIFRPLNFVIQQFQHMKLSYLLMERKMFWFFYDEYFTTPLKLVQYQIHQPVINFQHRPIKCMVSFYWWRRVHHWSGHTWWTPEPPNSKWKIQGQDQSMNKWELPEDISGRYLVQIWSSQTCGFTFWNYYPRETSPQRSFVKL